MPFHFPDRLLDRILSHGLYILLTIITVLILLKLTKKVSTLVIEALKSNDNDMDHIERNKRVATVLKMLDTIMGVSLILFGLFVILKELGFDITPLLTGAGVAGVALGFGSQSLVKDIIAGVFLLLENQIRLGDTVQIGTHSGTVERMELRVIVLRDLDGTLHIIPNGEIKSVSNMSYQWGRAVVIVPLAYQADIQKALTVIERTCKDLETDPQWQHIILEPIVVQAITDFSSTEMKVRLLAKTRPADRWNTQTALRLRLKQALDLARIPFAGTIAPLELV